MSADRNAQQIAFILLAEGKTDAGQIWALEALKESSVCFMTAALGSLMPVRFVFLFASNNKSRYFA